MADEARLVGRRAVLGALVGLVACSAAPRATPPKPPEEPFVPLTVGPLAELVPLAGLRWALVVKPREIASTTFLIPSINAVVTEDRFDRFAASTGIDLRQIHEAIVAGYTDDAGDTELYLARHAGDTGALERAFRARLTTDPHRSVDRPDLVRISGKVGTEAKTLALLGRDVLALQDRGSPSRGPARVAALYAMGKLKKSPTFLAQDPLRSLAARFGPAPAKTFALGPFTGELGRGARGLLAGATAVGAAARPSARERIALSIAVAGDFTKSGEEASHELARSWADFAGGSFGHLLGLDRPMDKPLSTFANEAVSLAVELDPALLARGLTAATSDRIEAIMR